MECSPIYQQPGTSIYNESISPTYPESTGNVRSTVLWSSVVVLFTILIIKDAVKALRRSKHWIPGDFLVLSSFTIQLLNLLENPDEPQDESQYDGITLGKFWMNHTSRIMLSVLVGYLIPNMANPESTEIWGKLMALGLVSLLQIVSDLYIFNHYDSKSPTSNLSRLWPKQLGISIRFYYLLATLFYSSIVMLFLLLGCSKIAGRGIERIVAYWIPVVLEGQVEEEDHHEHQHSSEKAEKADDYHYDPYCRKCWRRVQDALLTPWIVVRAYSVEYVIARSALTSSAGILVTFQIVITILGGFWHSPKLMLTNIFETLSFSASILQCVFIFIGWFTITWRWATAVAYYRKWQSDTWCSGLRIEEFWTRHLRELQHAPATKSRRAQLFDIKIKGLVAEEKISYIPPRILWYPVIWLQWLVVFFSKVCWLGSLRIFHNKLMENLLSLILPNHELYVFEDYPIYKKILDNVRMLGESPESLWLANRKSIGKAKNLIFRGKEDGEFVCKDLIDFLSKRRSTQGLDLSCLDPYKPQTGLKFLCKRTPQPQEETDMENRHSRAGEEEPLGVEEHFTGLSKKSWKMTAVSLLGIIVYLSIFKDTENKFHFCEGISAEDVKDCLKAYSQAWEIIDFVEEMDTEADGITSEAADKFFQDLQKIVDKADSNGSKLRPATSMWVRGALKELKEFCISKIERPPSVEENKGQSKRRTRVGGKYPLDRELAAKANTVLKLCNSIEFDDKTPVEDLLTELQNSLAYIINECLEKIQHLLLLSSKKWAVNSDERRLVKALYTVGKASLIMERKRNRELREERSYHAIVPT